MTCRWATGNKPRLPRSSFKAGKWPRSPAALTAAAAPALAVTPLREPRTTAAVSVGSSATLQARSATATPRSTLQVTSTTACMTSVFTRAVQTCSARLWLPTQPPASWKAPQFTHGGQPSSAVRTSAIIKSARQTLVNFFNHNLVSLLDAQCPSNSQYELCTSGCFRSCATDSSLSNCGVPCMEGCVCDEGYLMSGDECVPANQCGCIYEDKYYQYGQVFYPDTLCQQECTCNGTVRMSGGLYLFIIPRYVWINGNAFSHTLLVPTLAWRCVLFIEKADLVWKN